MTSTMSIIGSGSIAAAIGAGAAKRVHTNEMLSRTHAKAQALVGQIGEGATVGTFGATPIGDIVIVAVRYADAAAAVANYGDALAGKILVDISNPFNAYANGLVTTAGRSAAQEIAAAAPESAQVVKAFNTLFGHVLTQDTPLDAFYAGDSAEAKAEVAAFLESLDFRPRDVGGLQMAAVLEWTGLLLMGVAQNSAGFDLALRADVN